MIGCEHGHKEPCSSCDEIAAFERLTARAEKAEALLAAERTRTVMLVACAKHAEAERDLAVAEVAKWHLKAGHRGEELNRMRRALAIVWDYFSSADVSPQMCTRGECRDEVARLGIDLEAL